MQCDEARKHLFDYSEGGLSPDLRHAVDDHLQRCSECSDVLGEIWNMAMLASSWQEQSVPRWNRREAFFGSAPVVLPWLNLASVAASLLLVLVLLFQVELHTSDEGISLTLAGGDRAITREELEQRFAARDADLERVLAVTADRLTAQQVATNQLLLRTILQTSREERREDLVDIMTVWETDRERMVRATEESLGYVIQTQLAGQRQLQELSTAVRGLDIREDNNL